jgi:hypothetical protein
MAKLLAVIGGNKGGFQDTQILRLDKSIRIQNIANLEFHNDRLVETDNLVFARDRVELVDFHQAASKGQALQSIGIFLKELSSGRGSTGNV